MCARLTSVGNKTYLRQLEKVLPNMLLYKQLKNRLLLGILF